MALSCTYPDKNSHFSAIRSGEFAEQLAEFDLFHNHLIFIEEEIGLFFASIFNIDIIQYPLEEIDDLGVFIFTDVNTLVYYWDDIPVIDFVLSADTRYAYNYVIHCTRLYTADDEYQN